MRTVVVTGAASGMGAAVRQRMLADGCRVIGVDLRDADILADLSTAQGRAGAIDAVLSQSGGGIDQLICCAGLGPHVDPATLVASVNYFGVVALLDGLFDALRQGAEPCAVVVSSNSATLQSWEDSPLRDAYLANDEAGVLAMVAAAAQAEVTRDQAGYIAYASSKHAVTVAARQRAAAWGQAGVRLNVVAPGAVETPLLQAGLADPRYGDAIRDFVAPLGRRARPEEVAELIAFLCGPQAAYMHGNVVFIDGGLDAAQRPLTF
ncbi:putative Short-chain dehydrogenase/reductase SDR [Cupriavidus taiwanensis]|uniref:SDR family oxidoreductase n=1 Tax=Cupriavidus taiwanensis TaxID=164546 RepID=UPI000E137F08|nr:SDR family oxidoreductase [Cupriavidus taiwanensis]SOZ19654.1 putative Short-chain dehydrogenase/reductase SDR [Cupriavidus taiwanensis]SOZ32846.1 putative Short-chain dehydrogenase/reductase SDR [Cupriavidus taiwanensis]SOZ48268.1 putative Short-chain dehydrogenase/reductase SDR [Cupriavidus taiwanensis]